MVYDVHINMYALTIAQHPSLSQPQEWGQEEQEEEGQHRDGKIQQQRDDIRATLLHIGIHLICYAYVMYVIKRS